MSSELQSWLERMLPTDHRQQFMTVREAQQAFESLVSNKRYAPSAAGLKTIIPRYYALLDPKGPRAGMHDEAPAKAAAGDQQAASQATAASSAASGAASGGALSRTSTPTSAV